MDKRVTDLEGVLSKLRKCFSRISSIVDTIEDLLIDACNTKGVQWTQQELLWTSWTLDAFVTRIPAILPPYHRALHAHIGMVDTLRPHTLPFEQARQVINEWAAQTHLVEGGWSAQWEDICAVEIERWEAPR